MTARPLAPAAPELTAHVDFELKDAPSLSTPLARIDERLAIGLARAHSYADCVRTAAEIVKGASVFVPIESTELAESAFSRSGRVVGG